MTARLDALLETNALPCPTCKKGKLHRIERRLVCDRCPARSIQFPGPHTLAQPWGTEHRVTRTEALSCPRIVPTIGSRKAVRLICSRPHTHHSPLA